MMSTGKLTVMVLTDKVSRGTALGHSIRGPILQWGEFTALVEETRYCYLCL